MTHYFGWIDDEIANVDHCEAHRLKDVNIVTDEWRKCP
jgi:hypothetical protein